MQQMEIKEVTMFEVQGKSFYTREDALKFIAQEKQVKVMVYVEEGNTLGMLNEMLKQGITNKNKIRSLIKEIKDIRGDL